MPFIVLCGIIAFIVQMIALHVIRHRRRILRILPFIIMELFPLFLTTHALITKRPSGILGWEFTVVISGWIAGAILIGCVLAWIVCAFNPKGGHIQ